MLYNSPRGMKDLLPQKASLKDNIINAIGKIYRQHGFHKIVTPSLEKLSILTNYEHNENQKIIFQVLQRGEKLQRVIAEKKWQNLADLGLRFDLTLPLMRLYAKHKEHLPRVLKVYQIGDVWRAERPQRGRIRQFTQCDLDIIGTDHWISLYEVIKTGVLALNQIFKIINPEGIKNFQLYINNRHLLINMLTNMGFPLKQHQELLIILDKMDKVTLSEIITMIQNLAISTDAAKQKLIHWIQNPPNIDSDEYYKEDNSLHIFKQMQQIIGHIKKIIPQNFTVSFKPQLARGMQYYTNHIFEVVHSQYSIIGGGEYQNIFTKSEPVHACGLSIGLDRILELYEDDINITSTGAKLAILVSSDVHIIHLEYLINKYLRIIDCESSKKQNINNNNYQCISIIQACKQTGKQIYRLAEIMKYTHVWLYKNHHQTPEIKHIKDE